MIIEIEALDTLFFRDGKPFEKSDDVWATGMFPPLPSVLYGALRSAYLGQNDIGLEEVEEVTKGLRIRNIWYKIEALDENKRNQKLLYLPLPLDLVQKKELSRKQAKKVDKYNIYDAYKLSSNHTIPISSKLETVSISSNLTSIEDIEGFRDGLIVHTKYEDYLQGRDGFDAREFSNHFHSEAKIGIALSNATGTTSEGNLYRVGMLRTDKIKIYIEFDGLNLDGKGILKLGAENKLAIYQEKTDESDKVNLRLKDLQLDELETFKLCLTSPAIFENGIEPAQIFDKANVKVELITCAIGKAINVGGFDMIKKEPKKMYRAVPAGSVYHYKLLSGQLSDLENAIKEYNVCEMRGNEGFGLAFIGKI
jgi:CRISPR-associated protein Cmr3